MRRNRSLILVWLLTASIAFGGCRSFDVPGGNGQSAEPVLESGLEGDATGVPLQMEYLDRGTVAVKTDEGVYLSWRLLGTDDFDTAFYVYRNGSVIAEVADTTNYLDPQGEMDDTYCVSTAADLKTGDDQNVGHEGEKEVSVLAEARVGIPLQVPEGAISEEGEPYTYSANDATCADLDGDGEYEIILKWDPSNSFDSAVPAKHSGNVYIDAYKQGGELLWRIDLGPNISAGAHFTQMAAYDFDLDGKAELALKTAPGSVDGTGHYVSEASDDPKIQQTDNLADYRSEPGPYDTTGGRVLAGDEYLTIFEGSTGKALDTVFYPFPRGDVSEWGDDRGNRSERYLAAVAYLDGVHPHLLAWRGYYARTAVAAYRLEDGRLTQTASFDTSLTGQRRFEGQGNHNLAVADVDGDGKDEVLCGSLALDHDLSVLWCSERGHGDALHLADYDPLHEGLEYFCVHESEPYGMTVFDAATGEELFHKNADGDTGRGMMAHVGYSDGYYEIWSSYSHSATSAVDFVGCFGAYGDGSFREESFVPDSSNFRIYWDGDLCDELLDGDGTEGSAVHIAGKDGLVAEFPGTRTINGTKQNVCLAADLLGDWREEFAVPSEDGSCLYIYTTTIPTQERLYTLMHDRAYRMQVASQNAGYNQPPHLGYFVCDGQQAYDARKDACLVLTVHDGARCTREGVV